MMRRTILLVAAALLLSACSATRSSARPRIPSVQSTTRAVQVIGKQRPMSEAVEGQVYDVPAERDVSGYVPSRGLLVAVWPKSDQDVDTSPWRLLLFNPVTGTSENIMGPAPIGQEPVMVTSDRNWVFWGEMSDQGGGPQTYYLMNLRTGVRHRFTDALTTAWYLGGAALHGDNLYVAGTVHKGKCEVSEILRVQLLTGNEMPIVLARDCGTTSAKHLAKLSGRRGGRLPLRLSDATLLYPTMAGRDLVFVVVPQASPHTSTPSALVRLRLDNGATRVVAESPAPITAVAADKDVISFVSGQNVYAVTSNKLMLVEDTQNPIPSVSGPFVTCIGGPGDFYDARTGAIYRPHMGGGLTVLAGPWAAWFDGTAQVTRVARLRPSLLR